MEKIVDFEKCAGCHACYNACPVQCISMKVNEEGFWYPQIDAEKCIDCGKCKTVCPVLTINKNNPAGTAYACINKNEEVRKHSSSGGIFSLLADYVLERDGVVFGAAFDKDLSVCHTEISKKEELYKLRGVKYLQSAVGKTYDAIKEKLDQKRKVLFCGTPCQIGGLYAFLGKDDENLITADVICHGVPSPMAWKKYLDFVERKNCDEVNKERIPFFRDKKYGWKRYSLSVYLKKQGVVSTPIDKNIYMKAFLQNYCLRPSCYDCSFKSIERQSDITLADFWGVDKICTEFYDNKGTSLVIVNSQKGAEVFDTIKNDMKWKSVDMNAALRFNPAMHTSSKKPESRDRFMKTLADYPFDYTVKNCIPAQRFKKVMNTAKRVIRKIIRR